MLINRFAAVKLRDKPELLEQRRERRAVALILRSSLLGSQGGLGATRLWSEAVWTVLGVDISLGASAGPWVRRSRGSFLLSFLLEPQKGPSLPGSRGEGRRVPGLRHPVPWAATSLVIFKGTDCSAIRADPVTCGFVLCVQSSHLCVSLGLCWLTVQGLLQGSPLSLGPRASCCHRTR